MQTQGEVQQQNDDIFARALSMLPGPSPINGGVTTVTQAVVDLNGVVISLGGAGYPSDGSQGMNDLILLVTFSNFFPI